MPMASWTERELDELEREGLLRAEASVQGCSGPYFSLDGRAVLSFSSNNYLGLADDARLVTALCEAAGRLGVGAGASRLVAGSNDEHRACELELAAFVNRPDAILFSSGYAANVGVLSSLGREGDLIYSDELNHASIIDGCRLSRATVRVFPHRDLDALRTLLLQDSHADQRRLIVTDALFSMEGHLAPLAELRALADELDAALIVDEAHSLGVLGPQGRGACAACGISPDLLIGTLGKAFGVSGSFVATDTASTQLLKNRARSYVFSTAPPPALAAAIRASLSLVRGADDRRATLKRHVDRLRAGLLALGFDLPPTDGAILPILIGDPAKTMRASARLLDDGVYARGIRPPTVAVGTSRIRLVPMSTHTDQDIDTVLNAFTRLRQSEAA